ncbi:hypothetical protein [Bacillus sp. V59.32b]|uniref:hypothetical protein n=1 Tax=Bacillus sp. V59.32b TaxID=1758642 RepID=UPI000E3E14DD|nr:hypothetical protein [Bacillus sp. V59.32b]RFU67035.1 hypothetical protein D0463_08185 [Bacillus sp. V59.32b]
MRESFGILSIMFFILTLLFWIWIGPSLPANGQQGTNLILMLAGISLLFAILGKGKWRFVTLIGIPLVAVFTFVYAFLIFF